MPTAVDRSMGDLRAAVAPLVVLGGFLAGGAGPARAQAAGAAVDGASGVHLLAGGFVGRFDLDDAGRTHLFGGRAGLGFNELLELTGFYWRGFDTSTDSITADYAWGGELQLNLNAGFGLAPFVTGGIARVHQDPDATQNAALLGAGLLFPLGPVLLHGAARDYMFGVTGLETAASPENVTHNWLYSAGVKLALGSRRARRAVAAAPPAPAPAADDAALRAADAELAALRDSLRAADPAPATAVRLARLDSMMAPRNYQSDRRIEIPIPTEGSITLRYGPEPAAASPIVVNPSGATGAAAGAAAPATPPPQGASLEDPATQAWIQQVVAAQVADQLARRPAPASALTEAQLAALADRVLAGVVARVIPQLEAAQARQMNALRDDLRTALEAQREDVLAEAGRGAAAGARAAAPADPQQGPDRTPERAPEPAGVPVPESAPAPAAADAAERDRSDAALAVARDEAAARTALAEVVASHPRFLTAAETHRGPAAVLVDAAFEGGTPLVAAAARSAVAAVAGVLRSYPDRRVYVHGHTDGVGTELENQRQSELRAEAVRSLLVQAGVASDRLFAVGYGQGRPVADNATPAGRALNRRVEIVLGESRAVAAR